MIPGKRIRFEEFSDLFPTNDKDLLRQSSSEEPIFAPCAGTRKNGKRCTNNVNTKISTLCSYHMQNEAKRMRSSRAAFSAVSNEIPKCAQLHSPQKKSDLYTVSRPRKRKINFNGDFINKGRSSSVAARARIGSKLMRNLSEAIEKENKQFTASPKSSSSKMPVGNLRDFLKKQMVVVEDKKKAVKRP